MRNLILVCALGASALAASPGLAKGCIRGAVVGGVAGHYVGRGHALVGAAAGCVVAHHHYAQQAKTHRAAARR